MAISADNEFLLNQMNKTAEKTQLGTMIAGIASDVAGIASDVAGIASDVAGIASDVDQAAFVIVKSGSHTTAGGDAAETITVTGAVATDIAIVMVHTAGSTPVSIVAAAAATDSIAVTMSGDPSTDHVLKYIVVRAIA